MDLPNQQEKSIGERQGNFLEAVKVKVNFTPAWKVAQHFGLSNRANLIEGGLHVGTANFDAWNVIPKGAILVSALRFPPAGTIYFAIVVKNDCDRLIQRLLLMKEIGAKQEIVRGSNQWC